MKKAITGIIMLCLLAAMLGGCSNINGGLHMYCGGCNCSRYYDGCYIDGQRVWTDEKSIERFNSEVEACKQALVDYTDEMDVIAEDLAQYGSVRIEINKQYSGERFKVFSYERDEYMNEKELSKETIAAIEALENSGRFTSFGVGVGEDGSLGYTAGLYAWTPGYATDAHRGIDERYCNEFCEPLENGWCLNMWIHE